MENTSSSFAPLRNATTFSEVMEFLAGDNTAAIIESLRSEKWSRQLFPLYMEHPNHVIRYEVACSAYASEEELMVLRTDQEMIVRQAAEQNQMKRNRTKVTTQKVEDPKYPEVKDTNNDPEKVKDKKSFSKKNKKNKKSKQKDRKNE